MSSLLLLVDLQQDYLTTPALEPSAGSVIERATALLQAFRQASMPVIHLRTRIARQPDQRMAHWRSAGLWKCLEGTEGQAPPPSLGEALGELVLSKQTFSAPGLVDAVTKHHPKTIFVVGIMTHACVRQAVLDLYQAGFQVCVVEDAVASNDPIHAAITRRYLAERSIAFAYVATIASSLTASQPADSSPALDPDVSVAASTFAASWRNTPFPERAQLATRLAESLLDAAESLAAQIADDLGKPLRFARIEIARTADMIHAIVGRLNQASLDEVTTSLRIRRRPLGTIAVITPWNNPVYIPLGKILPSILTGNTVIWKPAPEATALSHKLLDLFRLAGFPPDLVRLVTGDADAARALMSHPAIDAVTITASLAAGRSAAEICSRRHIPLQAELGGNNAAIVWSDADLSQAAEQIAAGAFDMAGQRCTANRRVIVHAPVHDAFLDLIQQKTAALPWGVPSHPDTRIGPLINHARCDHLNAMLDRARADGCSTFFPQGLKPPPSSHPDAAWFPPTIVIADSPEAEIVQEETFGPILVVQSARDWPHALELCNCVRQGLAAALFTASEDRIASFLDEAQAGILKLNTSTADASVDVPFGGWKASGSGPAEHGDSDIEFYTRIQSVYHLCNPLP